MKYLTRVYFALYGEDFNPHEITKILKIQPTKQGRKGESGIYIPQLKHSFWELSTEKGKEYLDISILVGEIVAQLNDKIEIINSIKIQCSIYPANCFRC